MLRAHGQQRRVRFTCTGFGVSMNQSFGKLKADIPEIKVGSKRDKKTGRTRGTQWAGMADPARSTSFEQQREPPLFIMVGQPCNSPYFFMDSLGENPSLTSSSIGELS
jgi:hypothetical protein